jgi:putative endonuclease
VVRVRGTIETGRAGERIAAEYLTLRGYRIVRRNYRCGHLEVDLIAEREGCLAFVEVKTRRGAGFGEAVEAMGRRKIAYLRRAARTFLAAAVPWGGYREIRFDLIAVDVDFRRDTMLLRHIRGV